MVELLDNAASQTLVLRPNAAMPWRRNLYVIAIFGFGILGFATFWTIKGVVLALPMGILEMIGLTWALWWVARQAQRCQTIELTAHEVIIQSGRDQPESEWRSARAWTRVQVDKPKRRGDPPRVWFCFKGDQVEVGGFLNRRDRQRLIRVLKKVINGPERISPSPNRPPS